jgi:hypothetical protein
LVKPQFPQGAFNSIPTGKLESIGLAYTNLIVSYSDKSQMAMNSSRRSQLIRFLQDELAVPENSVAIALHHRESLSTNLIPMVLLQYGLITLDELDRIFDWLETA